MDRALPIRALSLYLPSILAAATWAWRPPTARERAGILIALLWSVCSLYVLQLLNLHFSWWSFEAAGGLFLSMPVDLLLGWAVLWSAIPALLFSRWNLGIVALLAAGFDVIIMPLCRPVVRLQHSWLAGETVAALVVLLPAQFIYRSTRDDRHLPVRASMQVFCFAVLVLLILPQIVFTLTHADGWAIFLGLPAWIKSLALQIIFLLAVPGVSAVQEFVRRGHGSPIPFDPPKRLVTSGAYAYVANPMQLSCSLVVLFWGVLLKSPWIASGALIGVAYGFGVAGWDERNSMLPRFGLRWERYREGVHNWRVRWRPWESSKMAKLYLAESCDVCSELRRWFEARHPVGLEMVAAEKHPAGNLMRATYGPGDGSPEENGVVAVARGLEHLNFAWAFAGFMMRLPVVSTLLQIITDAAGFGPIAVGAACQVRSSRTSHKAFREI